MREHKSTPNKSKKERSIEDVTLGIIHYTGSMNMDGTVEWFQDPRSKVSAHYVIGRHGEVVQFAPRFATCWHAGKSEWNERKWCNNFSIGYELVGTATSGFMNQQYDALLKLLLEDMDHCPYEAIVGHEQVSPGRKVDPGSGFNWQWLQQQLKVRHVGAPCQQVGTKHYPLGLGVKPVVLPELTADMLQTADEPKMKAGKDNPWWKIWA